MPDRVVLPSSLLMLAVAAQALGAQHSRTALERGAVAVTGATVVRMPRDSVLRDATIVVRDGRIVAVGPATRVTRPAGARRIDGRGTWVIPGLTDMHAHRYADEWVPGSVAPYELGVMLANGVTAARLMIGTPRHLQLRRERLAGEVVGPQLWVASPHVSGDSSANVRVVREVAGAGYDFVKLTTNGDSALASTWWLLDRSPCMVYGETIGANGETRRMTEVEIPRS